MIQYSGGRKPLRIRLSPQFPDPHTPTRPHRDDVADPLRGLPLQTAHRAQGEHGAELRGFAAHQSRRRTRTQSAIAAHDDEWLRAVK